MTTARILIADDDASMCSMLSAHLTKRGFEVETFTSAQAAFGAHRSRDFDVVVTDLNMAGMDGLELCERVVQNSPQTPVVLITAFGSLETAIGAIRAGAYDFVPKPFEIETFLLAIERAARHRELQAEVTRLRSVVAGASRFDDMLGESAAMRRVFELIERVADSDTSVLVTGESGTGKELVARALHRRSARRDGPFVPVNCAAVPEALLESELFGHTRGAFTDARTARSGLFVEASGGTLFLDELGEMPLGLQPKLLRALEERVVRPIGASAEVPFDVRLVAATNTDLESAVEEGRFRADLFYRINVLQIDLPPLRRRDNDTLLLAQRFVEQCAERSGKRVTGLSAPAAQKLLAYAWPGNVRELKNAIERAVTLARYAEVVVEDLPEKIQDYRRSRSDGDEPLLPMAEVERRHVGRVLEATGGNKAEAARILGFDRTTLYRKLQRYDL
ncbi:MAG: sigma-54-dependent Fis family transcriptional regulator [Polyangiaceae bacterium]